MREIFSTIQGEGRNTGLPATFIRFAGCNLNCPWCDTKRQAKEFLTLTEIMAKVRKFKNRAVIVTGGEPTTVVGLGDVLSKLKDEGYWLALETNGLKSIPELELFDYIAVSPKYFYRTKYAGESVIEKANEVRIVAESPNMEDFCRKMRERIAATDYYISPLDEGGKMHYRRAFNLMLKLNSSLSMKTAVWPPWFLSIQTHKVLGLK
ncbi:MAG: 7-carboxy-7-deazaguanine synthase QueE, partial [Kiritimatiellae bacterium]|nr:7-carboxy-7-deazaguanine synthase QueE [Kiritimatiellia bacterium]